MGRLLLFAQKMFDFGIGFAWFLGFLRELFVALSGRPVGSKFVARARGFTLQTPGVAKQQGERVGFVGGLLEGERGAGGVIDGLAGGYESGGHEVHLIVEEGGLHGAGAVEAPIGNGQFADDDLFGGRGRLMLREEGEVKGEKGFAILIAEDGGERGAFRGGEAVGDAGVGGRSGLAFGRDGASGFQGVRAVGGELAIGRRHLGNEVTTRG